MKENNEEKKKNGYTEVEGKENIRARGEKKIIG